MGYQDIMDENFKQKDVLVIEDKELEQKFHDSSYHYLIAALREGPMTVKEITKKYNEIVKKNAIKMDLPKDVFEKMKRSDKTIYRYIKELTDLELVGIAGQRLELGKTATENLYCRVAKVFLLNSRDEQWWQEKDSKDVIKRAARILQEVEGVQDIDLDCFVKQLVDLINRGERYIYHALNEKFEEVSKILTEGGIDETKKLLYFLSIASILYSEEKKKNLAKCYEK